MRNACVISFCISLLTALSSHALDFSRINISWQYDPLAEIELRDRVIQNGDILTIFLRFRTDSLSSWKVDFLKQPKYESESHKIFDTFQSDTLLMQDGRAILKLTFKKPEDDLLVVKLFKQDVFYYYDIPLRNGSMPFPKIYPVDQDGLPIFENYLNSSVFSWVGSSTLYAQGYQDRFLFADPPMADMKPLAPSILPDTTFTFSESVTFLDDYMYVVRDDSNASVGVIMLKTAAYYPEFKRLDELVEAMAYLLNEPEKKSIENSQNLKQSFDSFWLKTYVTKFRARNAIRNYFKWIKQSNQMFSDFKQGWKTDRGMLFIVFGVPDEVYRSETKEEWYYDGGPAFEFTVISTFFAPKTYALRRRVEFQDPWFENIAAIRRGTNE